MANHASPARLSLVSGDRVAGAGDVPASRAEIRELVGSSDPEQLHAAWLDSEVAARFNESVFYPYTSLKFHTLLAAALLDNYRAGFGFEDLFLEASWPGGEGGSGVRTVLSTPVVSLRVTGDPCGGGVARLGGGPARSFADVWSRLGEQPLDVGGARRWRVLDAELRRIRSWSTALQFIEDFVSTFGPGEVPGGGRDA
ncbi:hypothetical protein [Salinarchaeum laminariae]|uniref:hypothetical protein n=1 Tax=Salinarchaeum laminariae TaxID=869888 RepID=UPI0021752549|nr:hypothetical protein [Salinarchaeum laminariae]